MSDPDPVFAAIESHQLMQVAFEASSELDKMIGLGPESLCAFDQWVGSFDAMIRTEPRTVMGAIALLDHLLELGADGWPGGIDVVDVLGSIRSALLLGHCGNVSRAATGLGNTTYEQVLAHAEV